MIISVRGTNGVGKSTLVRAVMESYDEEKMPIYEEGRRRPLGYELCSSLSQVRLFVPGHYEIANGGIDTIKDILQIYDLILEYHARGFDVLYEGKNMSDGRRNVESWLPRESTMIVLIEELVETCVASVRERGHSIKESTIRRLHNKCRHDAEILDQNGWSVQFCDRESALDTVKEALDVGP